MLLKNVLKPAKPSQGGCFPRAQNLNASGWKSVIVMPLQTVLKADLSHNAGLKATSILKTYSLGIAIKFFSDLCFSGLLIP